jgi:hypothetical protein
MPRATGLHPFHQAYCGGDHDYVVRQGILFVNAEHRAA